MDFFVWEIIPILNSNSIGSRIPLGCVLAGIKPATTIYAVFQFRIGIKSFLRYGLGNFQKYLSTFWWHRHPCLYIAQTWMSVPPFPPFPKGTKGGFKDNKGFKLFLDYCPRRNDNISNVSFPRRREFRSSFLSTFGSLV